MRFLCKFGWVVGNISTHILQLKEHITAAHSRIMTMRIETTAKCFNWKTSLHFASILSLYDVICWMEHCRLQYFTILPLKLSAPHWKLFRMWQLHNSLLQRHSYVAAPRNWIKLMFCFDFSNDLIWSFSHWEGL